MDGLGFVESARKHILVGARTRARPGHPLAATDVATDADCWGSLWGGLVITASGKIEASCDQSRARPATWSKLARPSPLAQRIDAIVSSISSRCATRNGGFSNSAMRSRLWALSSAAFVER